MREIFRGAGPAVVAIGITASCSVSAPATFTLTSASVDAAYTCPAGAANAPYNLVAMIDVRNGTSSAVTIKSVAAVLTLAATKGNWLERIGDKYQASGVTVSPQTVGASSSASLKVIVPSACTSGNPPITGAGYGDYSVLFMVTTSSGTHTIESHNRHRLVAA